MLYWSAVFFVIALVAGALGLIGLAGTAAAIAKFLFVIFLVLFVASLLQGLAAGRKTGHERLDPQPRRSLFLLKKDPR